MPRACARGIVHLERLGARVPWAQPGYWIVGYRLVYWRFDRMVY